MGEEKSMIVGEFAREFSLRLTRCAAIRPIRYYARTIILVHNLFA